MTQTAQMILNDLQISQTIQEKINFIKKSKLDFEDFNNFRLLINSLENFEPNAKLSRKSQKEQINNKITFVLENLENFEKKIKEESTGNERKILNSREFLNSNQDDRIKFLSFMQELETLSKESSKEENLKDLLGRISNFLLNAENLNENEIEILEKSKEALIELIFPQENIQNQPLKDSPLNDKGEKEEILNDKNYKPKTYFYNKETQILSVKNIKTEYNDIEDFDYKLPIDKNGNYNEEGLISKKSPKDKFFTSSQTIMPGGIWVDLNLKELLKNNISFDEIKDLIQKAKEENIEKQENNEMIKQNTLFTEEDLELNSIRKHKK